MMSGPTQGVRGLECLIGTMHIGIPAESVKKIAEYEVVSPVPLARSGVFGLGVFDEKVIISVALAAVDSHRVEAACRRGTRGVFLHVPQSTVEWVIEVTSVMGFVQTNGTPKHPERAATPWIFDAMTEDGRAIGWVDVHGLLADLAASRPERDPVT